MNSSVDVNYSQLYVLLEIQISAKFESQGPHS